MTGPSDVDVCQSCLADKAIQSDDAEVTHSMLHFLLGPELKSEFNQRDWLVVKCSFCSC